MNKNKPITVPLLFITFNRLDTTIKVFESIKKARPRKLYFASDAPRNNNNDDKDKIKKIREWIISKIDWDCKVKTLFNEINSGCKHGPVNAINWLFNNEEMGIIIEDDCLPTQSFFWFCEELLLYYKNDTRIMHICGGNYQNGIQRGNASYYFSKYPQIWGWATWKRAWKYFDVDMKKYEEFNEYFDIRSLFRLKQEQKFWHNNFKKTISRKINTVWDFQWVFTVLTQNGLSITPNKNLVSNIGFSPEAVHMQFADKKTANLKTYEIHEITHPDFVLPDFKADILAFKNLFTLPITIRLKLFIFRMISIIKRIIKGEVSLKQIREKIRLSINNMM